MVAASFDLTPAEARVAIALARGASVVDVATELAVSPHTIRAQVKAVLAKTGTSRQAELVSLLAALPMTALGLR